MTWWPVLEAEQFLRERGIRGLEPDAAYELVLAATGDEAQADDARVERMKQMMEEKPG